MRILIGYTEQPVMVLPEEAVGRADTLLFPDLSSCVAVVAVLDDAIVGGHFMIASALHTLTGPMLTAAAGQRIRRLLFVGYELPRHDLNSIRTALNVGADACETYDLSRKRVGRLWLTVRFVDARNRPQFSIQNQCPASREQRWPTAQRARAAYTAHLGLYWPAPHELQVHFEPM